jgi:hypothetical protein
MEELRPRAGNVFGIDEIWIVTPSPADARATPLGRKYRIRLVDEGSLKEGGSKGHDR